MKLLIKYEIFQSNWIQNKGQDYKNIQNNKNWLEEFVKINQILFPINDLVLSTDQILKLCNVYDKAIINSQKLAQVQLNSQLLLITKNSQDWLINMRNFSFLKQNIKELIRKINNVNQLTKFKVYFWKK